jgi:dephospho-CoA kinase
MAQPHIIFISGASGAGKTALVKALKERYANNGIIKLFHFDSIGIPSEETMIKDFGSGKLWQKAMTYQWIKRILEECSHKKIAVIEGQTELTFIKDAFKLYGVKNYTILLVHANNEVRHERLTICRNQPTLVNAEMDNWADYLYKQANNMGITIIDNSNNLQASLECLQSLLAAKGL